MNMPIRKNRDFFIIAVIFAAAFFMRMGYVFQDSRFPLTEYLLSSPVFDQYGYNNRALFIASGNWLGGADVFSKEPLYSYFLAVIYKIFGYNHQAVYLIQALLTSIGVILVFKVSSRVFNKVSGFIASLIFAFYSVSIYYDAVILRESFITFLNLFLFYLILKARGTGKIFLWLVSGIVLGLSVITRQNILFPFVLLFIFIHLKGTGRAFRTSLVFTAGVFLVLFPVLIRNYIVSDYQKTGISKEINAFWVGNLHDSSGVDVVWSDEYHRLNNASEGNILKMSGLFFNEVRKRPNGYMKLYLRKIRMFFNGYEAPSNTNYYLYREEFPTLLRWPLFDFRIVGCLGLLGLFLSLFRVEKPLLSYVFISVLSFSVILFHIQARFRLPSVPFFIMFGSYAVSVFLENMKNRRFYRLAFMFVFLALLYVFFRPDLTYSGYREKGDKIRSIDRTNLALAYINEYEKTGRHDSLEKALKQCGLAMNREEESGDMPYLIKGYICFLKGDYDSSENMYKKALIYDNKNPFLYNELAGVYYTRKSYAQADICIKRGLALSPGNKLFEKNMRLLEIR
jgi:tetratricopeptide (TPR) repeat protein